MLDVVVVIQDVIVAVVEDGFVVVVIAIDGLVLDVVREVRVFLCREIEVVKTHQLEKNYHRRRCRLRHLHLRRRGLRSHRHSRCFLPIHLYCLLHFSLFLAEVLVELRVFAHQLVELSISVRCDRHYKLQAVSSLVKGELV